MRAIQAVGVVMGWEWSHSRAVVLKFCLQPLSIGIMQSVHNARIWRNSDIRRVILVDKNREKASFLGDEGYGIAP
jgi:hypothetical protein